MNGSNRKRASTVRIELIFLLAGLVLALIVILPPDGKKGGTNHLKSISSSTRNGK